MLNPLVKPVLPALFLFALCCCREGPPVFALRSPAPGQTALQRPHPPLNIALVQGFISAAFSPLSGRQRVRVEPAAEGEESTFDVLEKFA